MTERDGGVGGEKRQTERRLNVQYGCQVNLRAPADAAASLRLADKPHRDGPLTSARVCLAVGSETICLPYKLLLSFFFKNKKKPLYFDHGRILIQ